MAVEYDDLRDFIELVEKRGDLRKIEGAALEHEIGAITEVAAGSEHRPALLFDKIPGYPAGHRIFTNTTVSASRAALALGLDADLSPLQALQAWKSKRTEIKPIAPETVGSAAFLENAMVGEAVDITTFPAPIWHHGDGGPYIGSGSVVLTRDPDTGWVNCSIYRVQVHGHNRVTVQFDHNGRHGAMISRKYWDRGEPCPIAIVHGEDPSLFVAGFEYLPEGASELDFAGAIRGRPLQVHPGPLTGLPIPAKAEIVFEGYLQPFPAVSLPEGPFGEFTGYYAADKRPAPVMTVEAVHHRNDPILLGSPPLKPPRFHFGLPLRAAGIWGNLEAAGVADIVGAWQHVSQLMTVIALKQRYAGHAKRAGLIAAANSYMGRIVVLVDDDVDPSSLADVMWAVTTRAEPSEDVDIIRNAWSSSLDPRIPAAARDIGLTSNSKMIIDACIPFQHLESYPRASALTPGQAEEVRRKWGHLLGPNR
ncbi:UbiD family decarboxylase [Lichenifustis flavocetrariae]|uniref:UbiD family decarboxylase n=1 Tax=Lichenifustis flavocetrariae TaxID=2949735 RepID=A0AA41YSK8_9HYPH|nr:UbiD family decarboxylase [Lichenifustis flavocetrariae]MCW6507814.1 UbiD family decarboxylase [Lichenifustis flavocetrariae]